MIHRVSGKWRSRPVVARKLARLGYVDRALLGGPDADGVAERVPQPAVGSVEPLGRLLGELDALRDQVLVGRVDVVHGDDPRHPERALRDQLADLLGGRLVVRGWPGLLEQQLAVGLAGEVDREPAHEAEVGVGVDLEAELADVEVDRLVLIEHVDLCVSEFVWHGRDATPRAPAWLLQNCSVSSTPSRSRPGPPSGRPRASDRWSAALPRWR